MRIVIASFVLFLTAGIAVLPSVGPRAMASTGDDASWDDLTFEIADESLGSLGGYVREGDPNQGLEIEGAVVTLSDGQIAFTNGRGYFEFQGIPSGDYTLLAEAECYDPNTATAYVQPNDLNIQNIGLEPIPDCEVAGGCSPERFVAHPGESPLAGAAVPGASLALIFGLLHLLRRRRRA